MRAGSDPAVESGRANARLVRRLILEGVLRMGGVVGLTLLAYALIPIEGGIGSTAATICASVGIVIILVVYAWQLTRVSKSLRPILAVVEAVGLVFGLFLCMFSLLYVAISASDPNAFSEPLSKAAAIYFTVTVLATVGFGDIAPVTDTARLVVTLQMIIGVTLVGTAIRALSNSARSARSAHGGATPGPLGSLAAQQDLQAGSAPGSAAQPSDE